MQISRAGSVLLLVTGLLGATASSSWADHTVDVLMPTANVDDTCFDGSPTSAVVCRTDNATVKYHMESSLETADKSVVNSMMDNNYDETVLVVSIDTTPVFTGASETDIVYQEDSSAIPSTSDGIYWCDDAIGTYTCDQAYVRIEPGAYVEGLVCHESGHAVGLLHGEDSALLSNGNPVDNEDAVLGCMRTPTPSGSGLGSNQREQINHFY